MKKLLTGITIGLGLLIGASIPISCAKDDAPEAPPVSNPPVSDDGNGNDNPQSSSPYIYKVYEYCPAPGQFINMMPVYTPGDSMQDILDKCTEAIGGEGEGGVSLGAFGGYITFGFDHAVENVEGAYDFRLWGNAIWDSTALMGGSAEPGIVMVSVDSNGNGLPDDEWYELAGSEYESPATVRNYSITYSRPVAGKEPEPDGNFITDSRYIKWRDSLGESGWLSKNVYHTQNYWPGWIDSDEITLSGTLLPPNAADIGTAGNNYVLSSYPFGYADNYPNSFADENSFDISWAIDKDGNHVKLQKIHFIRVYTALNQQCGWMGETSTEIFMGMDLHWPAFVE